MTDRETLRVITHREVPQIDDEDVEQPKVDVQFEILKSRGQWGRHVRYVACNARGLHFLEQRFQRGAGLGFLGLEQTLIETTEAMRLTGVTFRRIFEEIRVRPDQANTKKAAGLERVAPTVVVKKGRRNAKAAR